MKKHILFIASLAAMVGCSGNEGPADNNPGNVTLIVEDFVDAESGRPFATAPETRSTLSIGTSGVDFAFENGDMLGVFPNEANTQQLRIKANVEGDESPVFSGATVGWLLGEGIDYASYYPFKDDYHQSPGAITFSYTGQKQSGNGNESENMTHLGAYDYLYSNVQTPQDNQITFTLSHAGAILHIRHLDTNGGEYESLTISAGGEEVIPTSVTINLFGDPQLTSGGYASSLEIGLSDFKATKGSNLNVWCMLPPADLSGDTLTFTFKGKNGTSCSFSMPGKNLEANEVYEFVEYVYALRYNAGEGEFESDIHQYTDIKVAEGDSCYFTVTDRVPVLAGHRLKGWSETDGGSVAYTAGKTYTVENKKWEIEDKLANLYAVYEEVHDQVTVTGAADPAEGGTVTIDGEPVSFKNVAPGTQVSLQAIPNLGYKFSKWSDGWLEESRVETINNNVTYTAEFTKLIIVNVTSSDPSKGKVTGDGSYSPEAEVTITASPGADVTITASPESGYEFEKWVVSESESEITDNPHKFKAETDISFTAHFKEASDGSLPGLFTINANGDQVKFSQGNLQYQASTNTWRFAEHQYDFVGDGGTKAGNVAGSSNTNASQTYSGWIDLFCWASSGYSVNRLPDENFQPWSPAGSSTSKTKYYINGASNTDLNGTSDWGYNKIQYLDATQWKEGAEGYWRTLKKDEWEYLLGSRSGNRYRHTKLTLTDNDNVVYQAVGLFIFKDGWDEDWEILSPAAYVKTGDFYNNTESLSYSTDALSGLQFQTLTEKGAVFLPANGYYTSSSYTKDYLFYWSSSTHTTNSKCYHLKVGGSTVYTLTDTYIYSNRQAVRLVTDVPSE